MTDVDDFDAFYEGTRTRLFHQMYAMTGNLADAQDCVQEAFARAWQHWETVSRHEDPDAWLRTVAWRIAASRWRKVRNGIAALSRHGPPAPPPEPHPDSVDLMAALKEIPEHQRRAIVLHHLVGLSVDEVALETGSPPGTVKARLSRGRRALAELLSPEHAEEVSAAPAPLSTAPEPSPRPSANPLPGGPSAPLGPGPEARPSQRPPAPPDGGPHRPPHGPLQHAPAPKPRRPLPVHTVGEGMAMRERRRHVW